MAATLTVRQSFKKTWREATWQLAVLAILLDALTTQAAMSWAGAKEGNPLFATAFNEYGLLWPVAIGMMLLVTVLAMPLLNHPLDKKLHWTQHAIWLALWLVFAFRLPVIFNNWYIAING
jgi:succinate-acetate transporter protein